MIGVNQVKTIISETGITTVQDFALLRHDLKLDANLVLYSEGVD